MIKKLVLIIALMAGWQVTFAKVKLPSVLSDNMVLQQMSNARLWGESIPASDLEIFTSWDGKTYQVHVDNAGKWELDLKTPKAGGPYKLSFKDKDGKVELNQVFIGEVWVCSGQSNMAMPMVGKKNQPILNSETIIKNANNPELHLFNVERNQDSTPLNDVSGSWKLTTSENVADFSAVAYQFGNMLQEELKIPVGIIVSSWGGTPIRAWMSKEALKKFPEYAKSNDGADFRQPSVLYNAMLAPLTSYSIAGFLWYQGENDRNTSSTYERALPAMVQQWRADWGDKNLPFYYVQIAPWLYKNDHGKEFAPLMREAQLNALKEIKNAGMVVTADIGSNKTIHPPDKTTVARRLSNLALNSTYCKKRFKYSAPEFKSYKIKNDKVVVRLKNNRGLHLINKEIQNFKVAGKDKKFYPASARIENGKLILSSAQVQNPVAARYGFKNYFEGNLFNGEDLPASSFRTDDWKINE